MIQVCTRLWPEPGPRSELVPDSRSPTGMMDMPVLEIERRRNHIDMMNRTHMLLPIAMNCLHYQESERPSSEELCQRLAGLKESREYKENVQQHQDEILAKENQILSLTEELQDKNDQLQQHQEEKSHHQEEIASREKQLRQLNEKLKEQEQVTAEIQQTNHSLQRQVEQLLQQLSQQSLMSPQPPPPSQSQARGRQLQERESLKQLPVQPSLQVDHKPHPHRARMMLMDWRDGGKAPFAMKRGAAVVDGNVAYFMIYSGEVCSYNSTTRSWSVLQKYPYKHGSLAVIEGQLTAIGGCKNWRIESTFTNKLLGLRKSWKEVCSPMPTKRRGTTAVTTKEHLIVAGGSTGPYTGDSITIVEEMNTKTLVWSTVASLPHPYNYASGIICGDQLYMLGGNNSKGRTKSVLTCSLTELLQSSSSSSSIWHRVADALAYNSTCEYVNRELLAVGGRDIDDKPTVAIHKYNPTTNSWDLISNMPTARYDCLAAVLPTNEMMVVGGRDQDIVEIATIIIS